MKRTIKIIILTILVILLIWLIFILVDALRLNKAKYFTKPLITIQEEISEDETTYTGLGYAITYIHEKEVHADGDVVAIGHGAEGAEFKLFGNILIWAYIE